MKETEPVICECVCRIDGYTKTVMEAIQCFCEKMFDGKREIDPLSMVGTAFSSHGLLFSFSDGNDSYKVFYRPNKQTFVLRCRRSAAG